MLQPAAPAHGCCLQAAASCATSPPAQCAAQAAGYGVLATLAAVDVAGNSIVRGQPPAGARWGRRAGRQAGRQAGRAGSGPGCRGRSWSREDVPAINGSSTTTTQRARRKAVGALTLLAALRCAGLRCTTHGSSRRGGLHCRPGASPPVGRPALGGIRTEPAERCASGTPPPPPLHQ